MKINEDELQELRRKALGCDSRGAAITINARLLITLIDEREAAQQNVQRTACAMCGGEDLHKEGCAYEGFIAQPAAANANR